MAAPENCDDWLSGADHRVFASLAVNCEPRPVALPTTNQFEPPSSVRRTVPEPLVEPARDCATGPLGPGVEATEHMMKPWLVSTNDMVVQSQRESPETVVDCQVRPPLAVRSSTNSWPAGAGLAVGALPGIGLDTIAQAWSGSRTNTC